MVAWLRVCLLGSRENFVEWHAAFLEQMRAQGKWVEKEQPPGLTVRPTPQHPQTPQPRHAHGHTHANKAAG